MTAAYEEKAERARTVQVPRMKPIEYVSAVADRIAGGEKVSNRLAVWVLSAIAEKADYKAWTWGEHSWRSAETIAAQIGYTDRAVRYAYKVLVAGGWLSIDPRPGRTNLFTVLAPIDAPAPAPTPLWTRGGRRVCNHLALVDNPGDNSPAPAAAARSHISVGGETVAADLEHLPTDMTPVAPDRAGKSNGDGADAPAHAAPRAPRPGAPPSAATPTSPVEVVAEPHGWRVVANAGAETARPSLDDPAAALSAAVAASGEPGETDPTSGEHWSRDAARRLRRCPRCGAAPGESCRKQSGRPRKANHNERRIPNVYGPAAAAGVWREPRGDPAF